MWPLTKIGLENFGRTGRLGQEFEFAPRHHRHIADGFQSRMIPDGADVAVGVRACSLAGRIDQLALINVIEVLRNALVQVLKNGLRAEDGRFFRPWILGESPAEPLHFAGSRLERRAKYEIYLLCDAARGGTTSLNESKPFHAGSTGMTPARGTKKQG